MKIKVSASDAARVADVGAAMGLDFNRTLHALLKMGLDAAKSEEGEGR